MPLHSAERYFGPRPLDPAPRLLTLNRQYELKSIKHKGYGLSATTTIDTGVCLISEPPLISISKSENLLEIYSAYRNLPETRQTLYLGAHTEHRSDRDTVLSQKLAQHGYTEPETSLIVRVGAVFAANAFNIETAPDRVRRAMFPNVARLNHSCKWTCQNMSCRLNRCV